MPPEKTELLKGTLDMLILQTLTAGPSHGYGIARLIEEQTDDALAIEEGSLYPALYRMEKKGWVRSEWGQTEHRRRAKFYQLTAAGRKHLAGQMASWQAFVGAVGQILDPGSA